LRHTTGRFGRACLAACVAAAFPAHALWEDKVEVFAAENVTYDSNVFRLSKNIDAGGVIGDPKRSDDIFTTSLGFTLDVPYSLQRWQASYTWYDANYRHFNDLDHRGYTGRAAWLWSISPELTGDLTYQQARGLASFANIQGRRPDLVTAKMAEASAAWMMTASWRLHGTVTGTETEHTGVRAINDLEARSAETGLSYVNAQENRIGVAVRGERGKNPHETIVAGIPFDNSYDQASIGVQGRWTVTGLSRLDGRLDYTRRRYDEFSSRNYSGPTFNVTHTYTPSGKLTIATVLSRDIAPLEDITSSFVLVTGIAVKPDWAVTEKINVRPVLGYSRWEYFGDGILSQDYEHRVKNIGVSVVWRAARHISLSGGVGREVRTSSLVNADYKVDTAMVEAHVGF
jgi:exopolysaccharide biosynthesis operon protein EpsL